MSDLAMVQLAVEENPEMLMPETGMLVDLRQPTQVADALEQVRDLVKRLGQLRTMLEDVLRLEAQKQGTKTLHLGPVDAVVSGGSKTEYDELRLRLALREAGLPEDRISRAVVETVSYKVNAAVLKQLAAANETYADIIAGCRTTVEVPWRVTTKRVGGHGGERPD